MWVCCFSLAARFLLASCVLWVCGCRVVQCHVFPSQCIRFCITTLVFIVATTTFQTLQVIGASFNMSSSDESQRVLRSQSKATGAAAAAEAKGASESAAELPDVAASDEEAQLLAAAAAAEAKVAEAKAARLVALRANIKALVAEAERLSTEVDAPAVRPPAAEAARLGAEVDAPVSPTRTNQNPSLRRLTM